MKYKYNFVTFKFELVKTKWEKIGITIAKLAFVSVFLWWIIYPLI